MGNLVAAVSMKMFITCRKFDLQSRLTQIARQGLNISRQLSDLNRAHAMNIKQVNIDYNQAVARYQRALSMKSLNSSLASSNIGQYNGCGLQFDDSEDAQHWTMDWGTSLYNMGCSPQSQLDFHLANGGNDDEQQAWIDAMIEESKMAMELQKGLKETKEMEQTAIFESESAILEGEQKSTETEKIGIETELAMLNAQKEAYDKLFDECAKEAAPKF